MFKKKVEVVTAGTTDELMRSINHLLTSIDLNSQRIASINKDLVQQIKLVVRLQNQVAAIEARLNEGEA